MEGFEFEGMWIEDPTMSPCGRFSVDPLEYYGVQYDDASGSWNVITKQ